MRKVFWKKLFKHSFCLKWNLHERSTYVSTPKPCVSNNVERKLISLEIGGTHKNVNIVFNPRTLNSLIELFFSNIRGSFEQYDVQNSNSFYTYINQRSFTRATFHVHLKRTWGIIGTLRNKYYHKLHERQHLIFLVYSEKRKKVDCRL